MTTSVDMLEAIENIVENELQPVRVALPARVESYDDAEGSVSVKPTVKVPIADEEAELGYSYIDPPVISRVPVAWPQGGGSYIKWKLEAGDYVLLVFADTSIDDWLVSGGIESQPESDRRFDISDAIAIPGMSPYVSSLPTIADGLELEHPTEIRLGAGATNFVALANLVLSELQAIKTWADGHTHNLTGVQPGAGTLVTTGPLISMPAPSSPAATKTKAE
jgi:hypothetical protein